MVRQLDLGVVPVQSYDAVTQSAPPGRWDEVGAFMQHTSRSAQTPAGTVLSRERIAANADATPTCVNSTDDGLLTHDEPDVVAEVG